MAKNQIPFIHKYCDRWCERCPFSARCAAYDKNKMRNLYLSFDELSKMLEELLNENLTATLKKLRDAAEHSSMKADEVGDYEQLPEAVQRKRRGSALLTKTRHYSSEVQLWVKARQHFFKEEEDSLMARIDMGIPIDEDAIMQLNDAIEIIHWYRYFINAKTHQSIKELYLEEEEEEGNSTSPTLPTQSDKNGSAKVALVAIDRSIVAWESVRTYFPNFTDDILDLFLLLNDIRRELLVWHPNAYAFLRPGFDEGWEAVWKELE